jgi:LysM repeat protein
MNRRSSPTARLLALLALVVGLIVVIVALGSALGGNDHGGSNGRAHAGQAKHRSAPQKEAPASYTVQNGDTLTSIAHETGVPVARIQALNPGVDPQILISGEQLKLR